MPSLSVIMSEEIRVVWKNGAVYNGDCVCNRVNLVAVKAGVKTNNKPRLNTLHVAENVWAVIRRCELGVVSLLACLGQFHIFSHMR